MFYLYKQDFAFVVQTDICLIHFSQLNAQSDNVAV